jgi:hypothetical protein
MLLFSGEKKKKERRVWWFSVDLIDSTMAIQGGNLLVHLNGLMPQLLLEH